MGLVYRLSTYLIQHCTLDALIFAFLFTFFVFLSLGNIIVVVYIYGGQSVNACVNLSGRRVDQWPNGEKAGWSSVFRALPTQTESVTELTPTPHNKLHARSSPTLLSMRLSISIPVVLLSISAAIAIATVPRSLSGSGAQQPTSESHGAHPHQHPMLLRPPGSSSDIDIAADGSSSSSSRNRSGRLPVAEDTYGRLARFAKYASAAYQDLCPRPLGNTLVHSVRASAAFSLLSLFAFGRVWLG